jgi:hypothetical protein
MNLQKVSDNFLINLEDFNAWQERLSLPFKQAKRTLIEK